MDDKHNPFYGTPLSRILQDDQDNDKKDEFESARSRRLNRINKQQTVRDDQGRQRFHGAFTGGFSAGYYNSVSSVEGFKPKQFISHRQRDEQKTSSFSHRPEDYMDEEDLGEFGIAPRKIRIINQYPTNEDQFMHNVIRQSTVSIGERILNQSSSSAKLKTNPHKIILPIVHKNDFHGLGYKSLSQDQFVSSIATSLNETNPLIAVLGSKRLKISGQAFGVGVLEDDADDFVDNNDAYGYDDMRNYQFEDKKINKVAKSTVMKNSEDYDDLNLLPGFILERQSSDMNLEAHYTELNDYTLPRIPDNWQMPINMQLKVPVNNPNLSFQSKVPKYDLLSDKFASASKLLETDGIATRAGLVSFTDLKDSKVETNPNKIESDARKEVNEQNDKIAIAREKFEWRPCGLLCKQFNVPNPFPDNKFFGTKLPSKIKAENNDLNEVETDDFVQINKGMASMEMKKSIYNIEFPTLAAETATIENLDDDSKDDFEDKPQIVEIDITRSPKPKNDSISSNDEEDVIILPVAEKEPEVIVISSDSSLEENDTYGPPLPPTMKSPIEQKNRCDSLFDFKHKRKRKKHKKHKN